MGTNNVRVLLVGLEDPSYTPGGLNRYVEDLLGALQAEDVVAFLLATGDRAKQKAPDRVIVRATRLLPLRLWRLWRAAQTLADHVDVVDVHFALHGLPLLYIGRLRHKPCVVHFHGPWAAESAAQGENPLAIHVKRQVEKSVYKRAARIIVLSEAFKQILVSDYGVPAWKIDVIPPGVNVSLFTPGSRSTSRHELGLDGSKKIVLTVRRLVPRMGHHTLFNAWADLISRQEPNGLQLLVVGDGPQRAALELEAVESGLSGSVTFLGEVDTSTLVKLYRAADASVVPSEALEGFGLVVLESLAVGTPVVASRVGGLPDALEGLDEDLLVRPGDPTSLADALERCLYVLSPTRESCCAHANRFNWAKAGQVHVLLYQEVVVRPLQRALHVVYLDHTAKLSGAELALARLLPALRPDVAAHVILAEEGPLAGMLRKGGASVEVRAISFGIRGIDRTRVRIGQLPFSAIASTVWYSLRLARRLHQLDPDLVVTNSLKSTVYGLVAGKLARKAVVSHVHDRLTEDYLPTSAIRLMRFLCSRLADGVVFNSDSTRSTLPNLDCHVCVIPPPLPAVISGIRSNRMDRPFTAVIVGRLAPWKGQDVFLRAFASAFPDGDEEALIVGSALFGEDAYAERLQTLAHELGVEGRVTFVGFTEDVQTLLADVDVLVHTSVVPEPFGLAVVEGMAAGLCVIASGEGEPASIISDGVDGILCEPRNEHSYAAALQGVRLHPERSTQIGAQAKLTAKQFSAEVVAADHLKFYRMLLSSPGGT